MHDGMLRVMVVGYATTSDCDAILSILHDGGRCRAGVCTTNRVDCSARFIGIPVKRTFDLPDVPDDGACFYPGDQRTNVRVGLE